MVGWAFGCRENNLVGAVFQIPRGIGTPYLVGTLVGV